MLSFVADRRGGSQREIESAHNRSDVEFLYTHDITLRIDLIKRNISMWLRTWIDSCCRDCHGLTPLHSPNESKLSGNCFDSEPSLSYHVIHFGTYAEFDYIFFNL